MKTKISISLDEQTVKDVDGVLEEGLFRNKSHVIEYAIKKFLGGEGMSQLSLPLETILGDTYGDYLKEVVFHALDQALVEQKIDPQAVTRLERLMHKRGLNILHASAEHIDQNTLHSASGGGVYTVSIRFTDSFVLEGIAKQFSNELSFQRGTSAQKWLHGALQGSAFQDTVPAVQYHTTKHWYDFSLPFLKKEWWLFTPIADGELMSAQLQRSSLEEREQIIERFLPFYAHFFHHLQEKVAKQFHQPPALVPDLGEFTRQYLGSENASLFPGLEPFISPLQEEHRYIIHGDLNPGNVLSNGSYCLLDWEHFSRSNTPFFDLAGKLFLKAGLDEQAQERLQRKASQLLFPERADHAYTCMVRTSIHQSLLASKRYLARSATHSYIPFSDIAQLHATEALFKLQRAKEQGMQIHDLDHLLLQHGIRAYDLSVRVQEQEYQHLKQLHDCHITPSQDFARLVESEEGHDPFESIVKMETLVDRYFTGKRLQRLFLLGCAVFVTGGSLLLNSAARRLESSDRIIAEKEAVAAKQSEVIKQKEEVVAKQTELIKRQEQYYRFKSELFPLHIISEYQLNVRSSFERWLIAFADAEVKPTFTSEYDDYFTLLAQQHHFPPDLVRRLLSINRHICNIDLSAKESNQYLRRVFLFDLGLASSLNGYEIVDERENAEQGIRRLAALRDKYSQQYSLPEQALAHSLYEFYQPIGPSAPKFVENAYRNYVGLGAPQSVQEESIARGKASLENHIKKIAQGVLMTGTSQSSDGGFHSLMLDDLRPQFQQLLVEDPLPSPTETPPDPYKE